MCYNSIMNKICKVNGCDRPHYGRGFCGVHWRQMRKYGKILPEPDVHSLPNEKWKDIEGFKGFYQVSNLGRVKSLKYNNTDKPQIMAASNVYGYRRIRLGGPGQGVSTGIHILVAKAFIPNPENKPYVNHKNGNKGDNRASNLEWVTRSENALHSYKVLGRKSSGGCDKRKVQNIETGKIYNSIAETSKDGFNRTSIIACCKGRYHTAGGYHWKYI